MNTAPSRKLGLAPPAPRSGPRANYWVLFAGPPICCRPPVGTALVDRTDWRHMKAFFWAHVELAGAGPVKLGPGKKPPGLAAQLNLSLSQQAFFSKHESS